MQDTTGNVTDGRSKDTRRWQEQDDNGHVIGSRQQNSNEQDTEEQRKQEDNSEYNKLDDRGTVAGNEAS